MKNATITTVIGMSILINLFSKSLKTNHTRILNIPIIKSCIQIRFITAMDVVAKDTKDDSDVVLMKKLTRYRKRNYNRQWEDDNLNKDDEKKPKTEYERIKKKKVALLLGYCGVDYYGMQRNPGVKTIEEDLLKALLEAKYITEEDFNNQQNIQFQRSSRTDKGVSAARQIVSLKLPLEVDINEINKGLPECIRVFGLKRVTNKFNSKVKCNARSYSYTMPTYVLDPGLATDEEKMSYRITQEKLEQLNSVLAVYKGTKCYHNFTEKKHFYDPSASRFMMGFSVKDVFVDSDMEFATLVVKGQSFMLHQIRKMVGLAIAVMRGYTTMATIEKAFSKEKVMTPTAPGLGLVLEMVHYDRYDAKYKSSHDTLTWDTEEEAVDKFKHQYIFPVIAKGEVEGKSMDIWLEKLSRHGYEPSDEVPEKEVEEYQNDGDDDNDVDDATVNDKSDMSKENSIATASVNEASDGEKVKHDEGKETCDRSSI